jgi:hypothetical protein
LPDGISTPELAITVAVVQVLVQAFQRLLDFVLSKQKTILSPKEYEMLHELHSWHNKFDEDGKPLWYSPRSWAELQRLILNELRSVSENQRRITEIQHRTMNILDRIERSRRNGREP